MDTFRPDRLEDWFATTDGSTRFGVAGFERTRVVTGPTRRVADELAYLGGPWFVVGIDVIGSNDEDVDVAVGSHVAARRGSEQRGIDRGRIPLGQSCPEPREKLGPKPGESDDVWRGQMVPVEAVRICRPHPLEEDDPLVDETSQHVPNPCFRVPSDEPMHLPPGEGRVGSGEDAQHVPVDGGRDDAEGMLQIHIQYYSLDIPRIVVISQLFTATVLRGSGERLTSSLRVSQRMNVPATQARSPTNPETPRAMRTRVRASGFRGGPPAFKAREIFPNASIRPMGPQGPSGGS